MKSTGFRDDQGQGVKKGPSFTESLLGLQPSHSSLSYWTRIPSSHRKDTAEGLQVCRSCCLHLAICAINCSNLRLSSLHPLLASLCISAFTWELLLTFESHVQGSPADWAQGRGVEELIGHSSPQLCSHCCSHDGDLYHQNR